MATFIRSLLLLTFLAAVLPHPAAAVQWLPLTSTARYQVAIDNDSIRLTPLGRLAVWLRFTPFSESGQRAAAADYGDKNYRSHMELYEIDCSEKSAVLMLIDIFDASRARLKRLKGNSRPDAIIAGSTLEKTAEMVCPALDDEELEEEPQAPDHESDNTRTTLPSDQTSSELQLKIRELEKKAAAEPADLETLRSLGNAYFDADLPQQAIAAYDRVLALQPDDTDVLNDQGAMYRQIGEFSKALANFERAFKADPKNLESLYNNAYVHAFDLNDISRALEIWRRYLELDSSSETARSVAGFVERYQQQINQ